MGSHNNAEYFLFEHIHSDLIYLKSNNLLGEGGQDWLKCKAVIQDPVKKVPRVWYLIFFSLYERLHNMWRV